MLRRREDDITRMVRRRALERDESWPHEMERGLTPFEQAMFKVLMEAVRGHGLPRLGKPSLLG